MSLWRRTPRALYRVYDEDEYLAGDDDAPGEPPPQTDARRSSRLLGLGLLVCVAASATSLVALHLLGPRASSTTPAAVHGNQVRYGDASATERTGAAPATPVGPATRSAPVFAPPRPKPIARRSRRLAHAQPIWHARASRPLASSPHASSQTLEATVENEFSFER